MADDIVQGHLGDCYFIACLAALTGKPERIIRIIKSGEVNKSGLYVINLCVNGYWQDVIVDDSFPVLSGTNKLAFAHARMKDGKGSLWVPLIEKAWAKLNGNYDRVVMGGVDLGFIHLCGVPSSGFKHLLMKNDQGRKHLWSALIEGEQNRHLITTGTIDSNLKVEELTSFNLRANHCYSVLQVVEHNNLKLLKLRNPWGSDAWNGKWSDQDQATWNSNSDLLDLGVCPTMVDDGIFWMSLEDYVRYFSFSNICHYNDDDKHSYAFMNKQVAKESYFNFKVEQK